MLSRRLADFPLEEVRSTLTALKDGLEAASTARIIDGLAAAMDGVVKDGRLTQEMADALVITAMNLEVILPVKDDVVASLEGVLNANKTTRAAADPVANATRTPGTQQPVSCVRPHTGGHLI